MNAFEFWRRWLLYLSLGVTAFGTYIALANDTALFAIPFGAHIDIAFWPDTVPDEQGLGPHAVIVDRVAWHDATLAKER